MHARIAAAIALLLFPLVAVAQTAAAETAAQTGTTWNFVVAGDSRNCGDVVMPAIAQGAKANNARFYWHLGDYRLITHFDDDLAQASLMAGAPLQVGAYLRNAWNDAIENQLKPFDAAGVPFFPAIGNHETYWPMSRDRWAKTFASYLDGQLIRDQRLRDDAAATAPRTYYHVVQNGVDFITLDNGTCDMFDDAQLAWFEALLARDAADPSIHTVVAGMHAALPDSLSCGHSMGNYPRQQETGRRVYRDLLALRDRDKKKVYLLASHSHFVMENVYDSAYWRANGGVLPGWIVGTSGAVRYRLPETAKPGPNTQTDVYGYLLGTVAADGTVTFAFHEITLKDIPEAVVKKYTGRFVENVCFAANRSVSPSGGACPAMSACRMSD
jgi:hypothetical protein